MVDTESKVKVRLELEGKGNVHAACVKHSQLTVNPLVASF